MPQLELPVADCTAARAFGEMFDRNDEAVTSEVYGEYLRGRRDAIYESVFWRSKARFGEARRRLNDAAYLANGWDTYGAEAPNHEARTLAGKVLDALEAELLPPARLMPSAEGGIAISFVEGDGRAEIEIYNTGEIAVATYSGRCEPTAWELRDTETSLKEAIFKIRAHLAA